MISESAVQSPSNSLLLNADAERLDFALKAAGIGTWELDAEKGIVTWDARCQALFNLADTPAIAYGDVARYIHPGDLERVHTAKMAALRGDNGGRYEATYRVVDGAGGLLRWVRFSGVAAFDAAGRPVRFGGIGQDVTDTMEAEQEATDIRRQLMALFDESPVALATIRREGLTFTSANAFYGNLVGRKPEELLGKPLLEALPELAGKGIESLLKSVLDTGIPFSAQETDLELLRNGKLETAYLNFAYQPLREADGQVSAVMVVAADVTQQVLSREAVEESQAFRELLSNSVPAMIFYLDAEQRYHSYNEAFRQWYHIKGAEAIGVPVRTFIGEDAYARIAPNLEKAYAGERVQFEMPAPVRLDPNRWLRIVYTPHTDTDGDVLGVVVHATDITQSKSLELALRASENRFRSLMEQAPVATCVFTGKGRHVIEMANAPMLAIWGKNASAIGKPLYEAVPELIGQPFSDILDEIYETGRPYQGWSTPARLSVNGKLRTFYFDFTYQPIFDENGQVYAIMDMAIDVTEQVLARKKLEESAAFIRNVVDNSPVAKIVFRGERLVVEAVSQSMLRILGSDESITGRSMLEVAPGLQRHALLERLKEVYKSGETHREPLERLEILRDGQVEVCYFNNIYKALRGKDGEIHSVIFTAADVTEQVEARQKAEAAEAGLSVAIEVAELGTWNIDLLQGIATYPARVADWFGVPSGSPLDQLFSAVPPADARRMQQTIAAACAPGSDGTVDIEHPVVSVVTGRRRIIHSKGKVVRNAAGRPVAISGTGQDVTVQKDLQLALEAEVVKRTEELAATNEELQTLNEELTGLNDKLRHSNEELAQYAYVASHDLQEPLRKIQVFSGMLGKREELSAGSREMVEKITRSSKRMTALIRDLLEFSRLLNSDALFRPVNLDEVVSAVYSDYELVAAEKNATLEAGWLPVLEGVSLQLNQLFHNLIGNALKFTRAGVAPLVRITSEKLCGAELTRYIPKPLPFATYFRICVTDNGIGFETQYAEQIFEVFKRLHSREVFPGSGIGLALCRRIVANHGGVLYSESRPGEGASFYCILPNRQAESSPVAEGFSWEDLA